MLLSLLVHFTPSEYFKCTSRFVLGFLFQFLLLNVVIGQSSTFFDTDELIEFTIKGDVKALLKDRGEEPSYHKMTLHYSEDGNSLEIPLKVKVRGNFRKLSSNCKFPPLLLNFAKSSTPKNSIFNGLDKIKLVTPCRGDEFVVQEYLVYKLYNLITPRSFKAKLVKVTFQDKAKDKYTGPFYGIILEEDKAMAKRNGSRLIKDIKFAPQAIQQEDFLKMAVFQYMIGNTDWSVQFKQNLKIINMKSIGLPVAVPYDFDHAGIVRAPYAKPAPELELQSTLVRRYRGYCMEDLKPLNKVLEFFNQLKGDFYAVYENNALLSNNYQQKTIRFLNKFYQTINKPSMIKTEFGYPCNPNGTGNIVIQGLKKH